LFVIGLLYWLQKNKIGIKIEYNILDMYFVFGQNYITYLIKMLLLIFQPLSLESTHAYDKQRVNKTFVINYAPRDVFNPSQVDCLPENTLNA